MGSEIISRICRPKSSNIYHVWWYRFHVGWAIYILRFCLGSVHSLFNLGVGLWSVGVQKNSYSTLSPDSDGRISRSLPFFMCSIQKKQQPPRCCGFRELYNVASPCQCRHATFLKMPKLEFMDCCYFVIIWWESVPSLIESTGSVGWALGAGLRTRNNAKCRKLYSEH